MNVEELTDLVIDKFKNNGGYIETSEKKMRSSIYQYLAKMYRYELEYAVMKLEHDKVSGKSPSKEDYVKEIQKVEDLLIIQAELIAVSSKQELEHFV